MNDILAQICADKRDHVASRKAKVSEQELIEKAKEAGPTRGFAAALTKAVAEGRYGLIAEIKKASPSAGLIRDYFDPPVLAQNYAEGGATCLSVLTDGPYFQGKDEFVTQARDACALPVLRKDFMVDPYQIPESRALGADGILVIMAALSDDQAKELEDAAFAWNMDVLVEVHNAEEMERALNSLSSPLIGVNNRNLKTMTTDIATTEELAKMVPTDRVLVSESGLNTPEDLARMARAGARRFLIGESLMRKPDVTAAVKALLANPEPL